MKQRVLLLGESPEDIAVITNALAESDFYIDSRVKSIKELCALAARDTADVIIIALVKADKAIMNTIEFLIELHPIPVVMFVNEGDEASSIDSVISGISAYVINGLEQSRVRPIVTTAITRFHETQKLRRELDKNRQALRERKLIERAKGLLMKQRQCSEEQAYITLRTLAMKQNKRIAEISAFLIDARASME